jgi:PAS domain S-box-containing protein
MDRLVLNGILLQRLSALAESQGTTVEHLLEAVADEQPIRALTGVEPGQDQHREVSLPLSLNALDLVTDAVISVDDQQRIIHFSSRAELTFGYEAAEVIGRSLDILLPDQHVGSHRRYVEQFAQGATVSRHMAARAQLQGKRKDGSLFPAQISILKYIEAGRHFSVALLRDVTQPEAINAKMQERGRILEILTSNASDLICLHGPNAKIVYASPSFLPLTGYAPEQVIGTTLYDYLHPEDSLLNGFLLASSLTYQPDHRLIYRFRCKDGAYIWLETSINVVPNDQGEIVHFVSISRDITERRRMEEELKQERDLLARIMETSPAGIAVAHKDGRIIFANSRAEEIFGLIKSSITARSYDTPQWGHTDYDGNPWPEENQPFVQVIKTKQPVFDIRHAVEKPDGERVYLSINGAPIFDADGEVSTVVFAIEDYTDRKHQQDELEAALYREKQLNELKTAFISLVSHEFRTPLAIIMTSTGLLRMRHRNMNEEEVVSRLNKIDAQVSTLSAMLADVTFINKTDIVGHHLKLVQINLRQFFAQLSDEVHMAHQHQGQIEIISQGNREIVLLDIALLQQIFLNLVSNAVKYSPPDGHVLIQYRCEGQRLDVMIRDNGIGIPEADYPNLFEVFFRARNVGQVSGTGLGLVIVKRAVDALSGSITFESQVGGGTTFYVSLPLD